MKHFTIAKTMLLATTLGAATTANAQVFELNLEQSGKLSPVHRQSPAIGDINGDGILDFYYGGQGLEGEESIWAYVDPETGEKKGTGWWTQGTLYMGKAAGEWNQSIVWGPICEAAGELLPTAMGLPPSTFSTGRWFDFNNDGKLDFYLLSKNEYGWNPSTAPEGWGSFLFRNDGEIFTQVTSGFPTGNNEKNNPSNNNSSISFGDYNNDGFTDVIIQSMDRWKDGDEDKSARTVALYKNNGDGTFTNQKVFNPIPYEDNKMATDLFEVNEETFEATPTMVAKPMTHGAVIFGDLNNDGWLDIVTSGYSNDGPAFYIYKNNGDGTFNELDLKDKTIVTVYESELAMADVNNDGWLDIISLGTDPMPDTPKRGDIYLNTGDGEFNFTLSSADNGNGLYGEAEAAARVVDLNHDGLVDIISNGWSPKDESWATRIFYQQSDGTFAHQQSLRHMDGGGYEIADLDGDGAIDLIGGGYGWSTTGLTHETSTDFYSGLEIEGVEAPEAPTNVAASYADGKLTVTWAGVEGETGFSYNVYVKNLTTGAISQIIPADLETGKLKAFHSMQTALRSESPESMSYTVAMPAGVNYEVGVQTIKPDWTTSAFTSVSVTDGISDVIAKDNNNAETGFYNLSGVKMNNAAGKGIVIMKNGNKVTKVIK